MSVLILGCGLLAVSWSNWNLMEPMITIYLQVRVHLPESIKHIVSPRNRGISGLGYAA